MADEATDGKASTEPLPGKSRRLGPRARRWLVGTALCLAGAAILGSAAGGWWLANRTLIASHEDSPATQTESDSLDLPAFQMPDVRGLTQAAAEQVLVDSGVPVNAITTHDAPSAARPGVVVDQSPAFGASEVSKVDLGIGVPVTMPDLAGETQTDAVETLSGYGVAATVSYAYSNDVSPGLVVSVSPEVGTRLDATASIVVATSGVTLPLSQIDTVDGGCDSDDEVAINGQDYSTAIACYADADRAGNATWVLSKTVDRFAATVGITDDAAPEASAPYQVLVDGEVVAQGTASFGDSTQIDVSLTGALQLTIKVGPASAEAVRVVFGNAVVYGSDEGIARLVTLR